MSSKSSKNGAYEILIAQKDAIMKITGIITPKSIDDLENELGGAFTTLNSTHFAEGEQYGYLACVIPEEKHCIVIANPMSVYTAPVNPGAYAAAALAAGVSAAHQGQITMQHKGTQMVCTKYLAHRKQGRNFFCMA
jgi:hypothetical protein